MPLCFVFPRTWRGTASCVWFCQTNTASTPPAEVARLTLTPDINPLPRERERPAKAQPATNTTDSFTYTCMAHTQYAICSPDTHARGAYALDLVVWSGPLSRSKRPPVCVGKRNTTSPVFCQSCRKNKLDRQVAHLSTYVYMDHLTSISKSTYNNKTLRREMPRNRPRVFLPRHGFFQRINTEKHTSKQK